MKTPHEVLETVKQFDAAEMQEFLSGLGSYFYFEADQLTNMNATKISGYILGAAHEIGKRTGE